MSELSINMPPSESVPTDRQTIGRLRYRFHSGKLHLVGIISAVVVAVTQELVVDTPAVGAVVGAGRAGRDDAHKGHERLAGGKLPFLDSMSSNTFSLSLTIQQNKQDSS
jgi:hypothetical protein